MSENNNNFHTNPYSARCLRPPEGYGDSPGNLQDPHLAQGQSQVLPHGGPRASGYLRPRGWKGCCEEINAGKRSAPVIIHPYDV